MATPDLSLIPLGALLDEIRSRCDTSVVGIRKELGGGLTQEQTFVLGDLRVCQGLAFSLVMKAEAALQASHQEPGPEHQE